MMIIVQIHLSWIVNLEYTCLNFYMEKLFSLSNDLCKKGSETSRFPAMQTNC